MTTTQELRDNFDHFDRDQNGLLTLEEFALLLESLHADMSAEEVEAGFLALDTDANGGIDFEEFCSWWED